MTPSTPKSPKQLAGSGDAIRVLYSECSLARMPDIMEDHRTAETSADLALAPILDVRAATALHRAFLERRGASIVVDASAVERIGGQCAAILLSAHRTFASDGHEMRVAEVSVGLHEGLKLLGIDPADIGAGQPDAFVAENQ